MNEWMPCSKLERQAPVRKKKRPQFGQRLARLLGLALALLVVCLVMRKVARPFVLCYQEAHSVHETERELRHIKEENELLRQRRTYLASKEGAQIEARKLGWTLPGERNIVIETPPDRDTSSSKRDGKFGFLQMIKSWF